MTRLAHRLPAVLAAGVSIALLALPLTASAQACCAGGGAYLPARLKLHEDALVALQVTANDDLGSLSPTGAYVANPPGASELDLQQNLVGAVRVAERGQLGLTIPFVETRRTAAGLDEFGGGLGDISAAFRYDFIYPAESAHVPGLALTVGLTDPSGRAPEQSKSPLLTDATGTGAWQGLVGGEVEQVAGPFVLTVDVLLSASAPRVVGTIHEQLGPALTGFGAVAYVFQNEAAVAAILSTSQTLDADLNGQTVPQSGRGVTTASLSGGLPLSETWRLQGSFNADIPALGRNRPTGLGGTFTVVRAWL